MTNKIIGTDCSRCHFSSPVNEKNNCEFNIINSIKDIKEVTEKNGYYYVNNYSCAYAFPKDKINELLEPFPDLDVIEYSKYRRYVKYYLIINNMDSKEEINHICEQINKLTIKPQAISILVKSTDMVSLIEECNEKIDHVDDMVWRLHNFKNKDISEPMAVHTVLSTSSHLKKCHFIWSLNDTDLLYSTDNKLIENINFIANVIQPPVGILKSKKSNNYHSNIFITKSNYQNLISQLSQDIDKAIQMFLEEEPEAEITIYDD